MHRAGGLAHSELQSGASDFSDELVFKEAQVIVQSL